MKFAEVIIEVVDGQAQLQLNQVATERDLEENHYLEEIGQIISTLIVNVKFCPYCGENLTQNNNPAEPWFEHHSFSN